MTIKLGVSEDGIVINEIVEVINESNDGHHLTHWLKQIEAEWDCEIDSSATVPLEIEIWKERCRKAPLFQEIAKSVISFGKLWESFWLFVRFNILYLSFSVFGK